MIRVLSILATILALAVSLVVSTASASAGTSKKPPLPRTESLNLENTMISGYAVKSPRVLDNNAATDDMSFVAKRFAVVRHDQAAIILANHDFE